MNVLQTLLATIMPMLMKAGVPLDILIAAAKAGADACLDVIEERIAETDTKVDDLFIGNVISVGRTLVGIEETVGSVYADKPAGDKTFPVL